MLRAFKSFQVANTLISKILVTNQYKLPIFFPRTAANIVVILCHLYRDHDIGLYVYIA